ncbi:MAG: hypothetical protein ABIG66_00380 [Candidatus Kerfeldbacteria bacterium]
MNQANRFFVILAALLLLVPAPAFAGKGKKKRSSSRSSHSAQRSHSSAHRSSGHSSSGSRSSAHRSSGSTSHSGRSSYRAPSRSSGHSSSGSNSRSTYRTPDRSSASGSHDSRGSYRAPTRDAYRQPTSQIPQRNIYPDRSTERTPDRSVQQRDRSSSMGTYDHRQAVPDRSRDFNRDTARQPSSDRTPSVDRGSFDPNSGQRPSEHYGNLRDTTRQSSSGRTQATDRVNHPPSDRNVQRAQSLQRVDRSRTYDHATGQRPSEFYRNTRPSNLRDRTSMAHTSHERRPDSRTTGGHGHARGSSHPRPHYDLDRPLHHTNLAVHSWHQSHNAWHYHHNNWRYSYGYDQWWSWGWYPPRRHYVVVYWDPWYAPYDPWWVGLGAVYYRSYHPRQAYSYYDNGLIDVGEVKGWCGQGHPVYAPSTTCEYGHALDQQLTRSWRR